MFKKLKKKLRRNRQNAITTSSPSSSSSSSSSSLNLDDEEILQSMGAVGGSNPIETASQNKGVGDKKKKKRNFFASVFSSANFFGEDQDKKYKDLLRKHIVCDDSKYDKNATKEEDDDNFDENFFSFQLDKLDTHMKMKFDILCMCYTSYIEASDKRSAGIELAPGEYEEKLELYTKHMTKVRALVNCSELEILLHLKKSHAPLDPDAELFRYR